jgi:cytochrome c oxidase subunit II
VASNKRSKQSLQSAQIDEATGQPGWKPLISAVFLAMWAGSSAAQQSALNPASSQADSIMLLWWVMLAVGTVILLIVMGFLGLGVWRAKQSRPALSDAHSRRLVIIAGIAIPSLILVSLVGGSLILGREIASDPPDDSLQVRVTGHMWWWQVEYLDQQGNILATTANEMYVPIGRPVALSLQSADVIHSFWVPQLQGKTDMVPGRTNESWFTASEAGIYRGQCAEFCGVQHALMAFTVTAVSEQEFNSWLQNQSTSARVPDSASAQRGQTVFLRDCAQCHAVRGTSARGVLGPDLTHIASRYTLAAATLPNNRGHLAGWISDPQRIKPGNKMPRSQLSPQEQNDLLSYLETLQ